MLKIYNFGMIYLHQKRTKRFCHFAWVLFSQNSAIAKFRENNTLVKVSEFTVFAPSGIFRLAIGMTNVHRELIIELRHVFSNNVVF